MPYPGLLHPEPLPLWQATADLYLHRRYSNTVLSQSLWGLWVLVHTRFVWALWASLVGKGFDSKCDFTPPTIFLGLLLCPWMWGILECGGSNILQLMVVQQWVVVLEFSQEKLIARPSITTSYAKLRLNYSELSLQRDSAGPCGPLGPRRCRFLQKDVFPQDFLIEDGFGEKHCGSKWGSVDVNKGPGRLKFSSQTALSCDVVVFQSFLLEITRL